MRNISIGRDDAETMVDILEHHDDMLHIADQIRRVFGMCSRQESQRIIAEAATRQASQPPQD